MKDKHGLTRKQKIFADALLDTGNGTKAAKLAYNVKNDRTATVIASENLTKPSIIEYFKSVASEVASNMYRLALNAESEQVQVAAGKDVLDRAGYKPVDKSEVNNPDGNLKTIVINKSGNSLDLIE